MELKTVPIEKPADLNFILGQSHFIKTVEDLHEAIAQTVPQMKFGIAFCESSGPALVRWSGNDEALVELAKKNALALSCGHSFIIFMSGGFPMNILNAVKAVPEVCGIYCATANPVEVIVAEVGDDRLVGHDANSLYRVKFDGFISDHTGFCVIGGNVDDVQSVLESDYQEDMPAGDAVKLGRKALARATNGGGNLDAKSLEVCILDRASTGRKFRRLSADEVQGMLDA